MSYGWLIDAVEERLGAMISKLEKTINVVAHEVASQGTQIFSLQHEIELLQASVKAIQEGLAQPPATPWNLRGVKCDE